MQLSLTSFVIRRFVVGAALIVLTGVMPWRGELPVLPTLPLAALMSVSDNSMNYSMNQSAKEALYVRRQRKSPSQSFHRHVSARLAKAVAVGLNLEQVCWLSVVTVLLRTLWGFNVVGLDS